jgi:DNA processing protein
MSTELSSSLAASLMPRDLRSADAMLALQTMPRIGPATALKAAIRSGWSESPVDEVELEKAQARTRELLHEYAQAGISVITYFDDAYPPLLRQIPDPPPVLYAEGRVELLNALSIAIVGSRNASPQGVSDAEAFGHAFSSAGMCVVSGMALGIDAAAHRGALGGPGSTIAVLGTGPDIIYPPRNRNLAGYIVENGLVVSEFPPGTPAVPANFPRRNRIISGLSLGVLVMEAAKSSGSLITARLAGEQGRDVFAVPGSIHSPLSKG